MKCKVCNGEAEKAFDARILAKYRIDYFQCRKCGFLQTEEPYWLRGAYESAINLTDTGILARNLEFSRLTSTLLFFLYKKNGRFLDYAGGYGIFTRLMRDIGFDFYWQDPYTPNLVARGFEYAPEAGEVDLVTSFESFEHFVQPIEEAEKMIRISKNILFSTELLPRPTPESSDWWYYGLEHGQHISFYTPESLAAMAHRLGLHFCTNGRNLHLFTEKRVSPLFYKLLLKAAPRGLFRFVQRKMHGKTMADMNKILAAVSSVHR